MNIVVLDGFVVNPGDLSWSGLESLGNTTVYDRTPTGKVVDRAASADIVLTNKTRLSREHICRLPRLKYIGVLATGYDVVDVEAAAERGIPVTNIPAYSTRSVAQMAVALLLELTQRVGHHDQTVREGRWARSLDFCYWDHELVELDRLTMGVVGFGRIGQAVAELALAFGMRVLACTRSSPPTQGRAISFVSLDELFSRSDVVSLHCPLTPQTEGLVDADRLGQMKPSAILINTARGRLVDERALAEALEKGTIAGAGLDVLASEPPAADSPLLAAPNCFITPHIGWATRAARTRLMAAVVSNVEAFLAGRDQNRVC